ncbi:uncharacterized protein EAF02_003176 [Botrytis sinoallii]|uniref:uncharacterized protein n=1 Tax=Botrytis sinoallii TaxID=1463999 RepID=UPI0019017E8E|nr:uncharacterized protein EAF02_003176 [Botrytis sinoallii]KAF7888635.1 hypothetical protein EAF02_003176 [Botrytis sinoallii]
MMLSTGVVSFELSIDFNLQQLYTAETIAKHSNSSQLISFFSESQFNFTCHYTFFKLIIWSPHYTEFGKVPLAIPSSLPLEKTVNSPWDSHYCVSEFFFLDYLVSTDQLSLCHYLDFLLQQLLRLVQFI